MASGYYSTASGDYNKALGNRSFVTGYSNTAAATSNYSLISGQLNSSTTECTFTGGISNTNKGSYSLVFGNTNTLPSGSASIVAGGQNQITAPSGKNPAYGVCLGGGNKGNLFYGMMIGTENKSGSYGGSRLIGDKLESTNADQMIIGRLNNTTTSLSTPNVIIANGYNVGATDYRQSAIEINQTDTKILTNLQLASDTTAVNAITPAQNSPASIDDMTLVTKSYISSDVGHCKTYWTGWGRTLTANTSYSIGSLIGDNSWTFPFSSGSIVFALYVNGIEYRATLILAPFLDSSVTPQLKVPITACYNYNNGDNGRLDGVLLIYNTSTKEISFENPEGIEVDNVGDSLIAAYNWGNIDIYFLGLSCFDHI